MKTSKALVWLSWLIAALALVAAGVGQFIGFTVPFGILTLFAIWFTVVLFRDFADSTLPRETRPGTRMAHI